MNHHLRDQIKASWDKLPETSRNVLSLLRPFKGNIDLSEIHRYFKFLKYESDLKSLPQVFRQAEQLGLLSHIPDSAFFRMLPAFRSFLINDQEAIFLATNFNLRAAFRSYYIFNGNRVIQAIKSQEQKDQQLFISFLDLEYENFLTALFIYIEDQWFVNAEISFSLLNVLLSETNRRGEQIELSNRIQAQLKLPDDSSKVHDYYRFRGTIFSILAGTYLHQQQFSKSIIENERALIEFKRSGQQKKITWTVLHLGLAYVHLQQLDKGRNLLEKAMQMAKGQNDYFHFNMAIINIGALELQARNYAECYRVNHQLTSQPPPGMSTDQLGVAYMNLGLACKSLNNYGKSNSSLLQALDHFKAANKLSKAAEVYVLLGNNLIDLSDGLTEDEKELINEAKSCYHEAIDIFITIEDRYNEGNCYLLLGKASILGRGAKEMIDFGKKAKNIFQQFDDQERQAECHQILALGYTILKQPDKRNKHAERAIALYNELKLQSRVEEFQGQLIELSLIHEEDPLDAMNEDGDFESIATEAIEYLKGADQNTIAIFEIFAKAESEFQRFDPNSDHRKLRDQYLKVFNFIAENPIGEAKVLFAESIERISSLSNLLEDYQPMYLVLEKAVQMLDDENSELPQIQYLVLLAAIAADKGDINSFKYYIYKGLDICIKFRLQEDLSEDLLQITAEYCFEFDDSEFIASVAEKLGRSREEAFDFLKIYYR